ncbi:MAG: peptidase S9 [Bacteroidetes bacterium]|nr:MAG: peptidase S9 [Bacteroidota bacterium]
MQEPRGVNAQPKNQAQFTPELLWGLGRISSFSVSPDGGQVVYIVTRYDMAENKGYGELYVQPVPGGEACRLEISWLEIDEGKKSGDWRHNLRRKLSNLDWGKDGLLRFIAPEGDGADAKMQIFTLDPGGGKARCISDAENGVEGFKISPDGQMVAYASAVKVVDTVQDRWPDLGKTSGMVYDDLMYRHWNEWDDGKRVHLFVASWEQLLCGDAQDVLAGEPYHSPMKPFGGMEEVAWTADSRGLAYTCKKLEGKEAAFSTNSHVYIYSLENGETRCLTEGNDGYDMCPVFSPDGRYVAWSSMARAGFEADRARLLVEDLESGERVELSRSFDHSPMGVKWADDGRSVYFAAGVNGTYQLFAQGVDEPQPRQLTQGQYDHTAFRLAGDSLVLLRASMVEPHELYRLDGDGAVVCISGVNDALLEGLPMPTVEARWMDTPDGHRMLSWVVYPPDFDAQRKYPALLYCQGGPQSAVSQFWSYRWNLALMAAQGYVVVAPNRRGTLSFGQAWTDAISKHHGTDEMRDLLGAMDEVALESWCDADRLGAVGASYGGFTVNWLMGNHQGRFKAFISHCGIFDSPMMYYTTEEMFFEQWEMGGAPWELDNAVAQAGYAQSPSRFVEQWDTPILVIHGAKDFRIPYSQGLAVHNAARMRGVDSRLLFFPDEGHWVNGAQNGLLWQREFFAWLEKYLKG